MDIYDINLCDATEEELRYLETAVQTQLTKRKQAKVNRVINNFEKAFEELLPFVDVFYEDYGDRVYLQDFSKFKFE